MARAVFRPAGPPGSRFQPAMIRVPCSWPSRQIAPGESPSRPPCSAPRPAHRAPSTRSRPGRGKRSPRRTACGGGQGDRLGGPGGDVGGLFAPGGSRRATGSTRGAGPSISSARGAPGRSPSPPSSVIVGESGARAPGRRARRFPGPRRVGFTRTRAKARPRGTGGGARGLQRAAVHRSGGCRCDRCGGGESVQARSRAWRASSRSGSSLAVELTPPAVPRRAAASSSIHRSDARAAEDWPARARSAHRAWRRRRRPCRHRWPSSRQPRAARSTERLSVMRSRRWLLASRRCPGRRPPSPALRASHCRGTARRCGRRGRCRG